MGLFIVSKSQLSLQSFFPSNPSTYLQSNAYIERVLGHYSEDYIRKDPSTTAYSRFQHLQYSAYLASFIFAFINDQGHTGYWESQKESRLEGPFQAERW